MYIADTVELGADTSCLRIGELTVYVHQDLIGLIQFFHHDIDIVCQAREAAHDNQAGNGNDDCCKGHKAMAENAQKAFLQQIP